MIEIRYIEGNHCPLVVCDTCGDPIREVHGGIVTWNEDTYQPRYRHKGTACDDQQDPYSSELEDFLRDLIWNSGFTKPVWPHSK